MILKCRVTRAQLKAGYPRCIYDHPFCSAIRAAIGVSEVEIRNYGDSLALTIRGQDGWWHQFTLPDRVVTAIKGYDRIPEYPYFPCEDFDFSIDLAEIVFHERMLTEDGKRRRATLRGNLAERLNASAGTDPSHGMTPDPWWDSQASTEFVNVTVHTQK